MEIGRFVDTRKEEVTIKTRRLPHWTADGGIYFVTFRLGDSLLWEHESFDHLVRNGESYDGIIRYIAENPLQAGLKDWNWVYLSPKTRDR